MSALGSPLGSGRPDMSPGFRESRCCCCASAAKACDAAAMYRGSSLGSDEVGPRPAAASLVNCAATAAALESKVLGLGLKSLKDPLEVAGEADLPTA